MQGTWKSGNSWGLPVSIRRDPIPLSLDTQCLTLGGRGYLGLGRGLLGLGRVVGLDGGLVYVSVEDIWGNRCPPPHKVGVQSCKVYVKPEEGMAYYVINKVSGKLEL